MSPFAEALLGLYHVHAEASRAKDEPRRQRIYAAIETFEVEFPSAKTEVDALYSPKDSTDEPA